MKTITVQDKALAGMNITMLAQCFDDLKQAARQGETFTNEQLAELFEKTEKFLDDMTEFFVKMVKEESP